jgi:iron complex outermembrane receptor protein
MVGRWWASSTHEVKVNLHQMSERYGRISGDLRIFGGDLGGFTRNGLLAAASMLAINFGVTSLACAQDASATETSHALATASAADTGTTVQEVIVTGTLLHSTSAEKISPVTTVGKEQIKQQGVTRIEDLLNNLPQVYGSLTTSTQGSNIADAGTSTVNLRDLGSQRTLVLINGRRLMPGDPLLGQSADLNNIPTALVDRVEVVTGGASATYGSDAVAGVVNFIMKKNVQGLTLDVQYSGYEHTNDNPVESVLTANGFKLPPSQVADGGTIDINGTLGLNTSDGKGNITLYGGYRQTDPVTDADRDYSVCSLSSGAHFGCVLSGTTNPAEFQVLTSTGAIAASYALNHTTGNTFVPYNNAVNGFSAENYDLQRPATRVIGGAFGTYDVNSNVEVYTELMAMDNQSTFLESPAGTYLFGFQVACNNPLLSAQEQSAICAGLPSTATTTLKIAQRNVQGGPRLDEVRNTSYRAVLGVRGQLGENWTYDVYGQTGTTLYQENLANSVSTIRIQNGLNAVVNPANNQIVCASYLSGVSPGCVPYNVFAVGGITSQAVKYIEVPAEMTGSTSEQVVNAALTGNLGGYGLKSPFADQGASIAIGAQYRREAMSLDPDEEWQSGDLTGAGTRLPVSGSFDVYEAYTELSVPLVRDVPFIKDLTFDGGYRFSDYSSAGGTNTYKFGMDWEPVSDIRFRASYQRAVRAPSVEELFSGQSIALFTGSDPCSGSTPVYTLAQCERTGATPANYGSIPALNGQSPNELTGGNPNLKPETSDTTSFGLTFTPHQIPGLMLSVDYFNIAITDVIGTIAPSLAITECATTGNALYCGQIHRAPGSGALFSDPNGYVIATDINAGDLTTSGIDFAGSYNLDFDRWGATRFGRGVRFDFTGTYLGRYNVEPIPGLGSYDCQGLYGPTCGTPLPKWRHELRTTWTTPWSNLQLSLAWRFVGGVRVEKTSSSPFLSGPVLATDANIPSFSYLDFVATERVNSKLTVRLGVNNLLDQDPPLVGSTDISSTSAANTFPGLYDVMGRYIFCGVSVGL